MKLEYDHYKADNYTVRYGDTPIAKAYNEANAKLIVAAVNSASALAEELSRILSNPAFQDLIAANPKLAYLDRDARAALAAYRGAK